MENWDMRELWMKVKYGTAFYENCGSRERGEINEYIS